MADVLLYIVIGLVLVNMFITLLSKKDSSSKVINEISNRVNNLEKAQDRLEGLLREELRLSRDGANSNSRDIRSEMTKLFSEFQNSILARINEGANLQSNQFETFNQTLAKFTGSNENKLDKMTDTIEKRLQGFQAQINNDSQANRKDLTEALKSFEEKLTLNMASLNGLLDSKFNDLLIKQGELITSIEHKFDKVRETLQNNIESMQKDNNEKLEKMRETVDEKLHRTLEERLNKSFSQVSERLEQVHKGLGDMQNLATNVGDLKKVLSNVKTRGILGEMRLESILEQILSTEQYSKNVSTKKGSKDVVEFAIKLPGKDDSGSIVYLPVDSKFPLDYYHNLVNAYETGKQEEIDKASKELEICIKKCAKDIRDKYIDPPNTTDFAIMFLPIEGLYAEVLRRTSIFESLQKDYKINITGPTTLAALLNSLQMGFKTLAIEKRSSEVWKVLGAVRTEFERFGEVLANTQKKLSGASIELDKLVGLRTRQIQSKLKSIEKLPEHEVDKYIESASDILLDN
jgi:DNA recombination protein RmuC